MKYSSESQGGAPSSAIWMYNVALLFSKYPLGYWITVFALCDVAFRHLWPLISADISRSFCALMWRAKFSGVGPICLAATQRASSYLKKINFSSPADGPVWWNVKCEMWLQVLFKERWIFSIVLFFYGFTLWPVAPQVNPKIIFSTRHSTHWMGVQPSMYPLQSQGDRKMHMYIHVIAGSSSLNSWPIRIVPYFSI